MDKGKKDNKQKTNSFNVCYKKSELATYYGIE